MHAHGQKVVVFVEDLYNELEFWYPKFRLLEEGIEVVVAGPEAGKVFKGKSGLAVVSDAAFADLNSQDLDGVIIPGGYAPDRIRLNPDALRIVNEMDKAGKLVAHICHAGWVPVSAGIMNGRKTTSYAAIRDDLVNAGAVWSDEAVVVDKNLVSSRTPDDLPVFMQAVLAVLAGEER